MFQSTASCWRLLCWNRKGKTRLVLSCPAERDRNACREFEGSFIPRARVNMADNTRQIHKSKSSSHFPNFDASKAWQMGPNSRQGSFFLGQELLLDFAAWIDLTSNADNLPLVSVALEVTEHIFFL